VAPFALIFSQVVVDDDDVADVDVSVDVVVDVVVVVVVVETEQKPHVTSQDPNLRQLGPNKISH